MNSPCSTEPVSIWRKVTSSTLGTLSTLRSKVPVSLRYRPRLGRSTRAMGPFEFRLRDSLSLPQAIPCWEIQVRLTCRAEIFPSVQTEQSQSVAAWRESFASFHL